AFADSAGTAMALDEGALSMEDPALALADAISERRAAFQRAFAGLSAQEQELERQRGRAQFDVYGTTVPPDATFSLRLADGVVAGYPYNGTVAPPYVTFFGLYDHYTSYAPTEIAESWALPERWLDPPDTFDYSTPLNLVSTNDIVGGNSGSPLLNRDLEVVGLVFDGNIESLPTAFIFRTDRSRTISVDARGILEAFDDVYDLDRLVLELTAGELAETEAAADAARD
ncbi:MAG: S46 family peptidase, partial [Rhodothermales bacterium]|nr:S46 family peptidase [Rhodothermales bacterium]